MGVCVFLFLLLLLFFFFGGGGGCLKLKDCKTLLVVWGLRIGLECLFKPTVGA